MNKMDKPLGDSPVRLFCFPHAGGSTPTYYQWRNRVGVEPEIVPIEYPGHGTRLGEPLLKSVDELVGDFLTNNGCERPFGLFGHSMGALVAFEVARHLRREGKAPECLFVSAFRAPHLPLGRPPLHGLPDHELIRQLEARFLEKSDPQQSELLRVLLPVIRADLGAIETWTYREDAAFDFPLVVLGGHSDSEVSRSNLDAWREHAAGAFSVKMFPGGHFYHESNTVSVTRLLQQRLRRPEGGL